LGVNECMMCSIFCQSAISTLKIMDAIMNNDAAWADIKEFTKNVV